MASPGDHDGSRPAPRVLSETMLLDTLDAANGTARDAARLIAALSPDLDEEAVLDLTIGECNRLLLDLREAAFGPEIAGVAACPSCSAPVGVTLATAALRQPVSRLPPEGLIVRLGQIDLHLRPLRNADMLAVARLPDAAARHALIGRCVLAAARDGAPVAADALTGAEVAAIVEALEKADPQADLVVELACMSCAATWQVALDVAAFVLIEVRQRALRLLSDVHRLALAYHWSEATILALSPRRRRRYLDLLNG